MTLKRWRQLAKEHLNEEIMLEAEAFVEEQDERMAMEEDIRMRRQLEHMVTKIANTFVGWWALELIFFRNSFSNLRTEFQVFDAWLMVFMLRFKSFISFFLEWLCHLHWLRPLRRWWWWWEWIRWRGHHDCFGEVIPNTQKNINNFNFIFIYKVRRLVTAMLPRRQL